MVIIRISTISSGILGDRFGERIVILFTLGGTSIMSVFLAVSPNFAVFVVCAIGFGAVTGLHYSTATSLLTRMYDNIGTAIGLHTIGTPAEGLIAPIVAAWVSVRYGWRPAIAVTAFVLSPYAYTRSNHRDPTNRYEIDFRFARSKNFV